MRVKFSLSIGFSGAEHTSIEEFPDGTPDEDIEAHYITWRDNYLDGGWWVAEEDDEE